MYRQCSLGVLDTDDDPDMTFDDEGRSNYFHAYKAAESEWVRTGDEGERLLQALATRIKQDGAGKPYDCIMGLSGGVDSTYVAFQAHRLGLRPLAVHLDNGWNSETAVQNIEHIVNQFDIDLYTHVLNWDEFSDLQRSYLQASVVDIEVVTDHAIFTLLYKLAQKYRIKHILSGTNVVTEFVMPPHWIYNKTDHVNIKAIHDQFGRVKLTNYPFMDLKVKKWVQLTLGVKSHSILNWVDYQKDDVKSFIQSDLGWRDYGGKHYESIFTRFYQGYILPKKFGIDKRKAHLTNLIYAGQITKESALATLQEPPLDPVLAEEDRSFVIKKLGYSDAEFENIMKAPARSHFDFPVETGVYDSFPILKPIKPVTDWFFSSLRSNDNR